MTAERSLQSRLFQPKLRMFYNGSTDVNVVRADGSASVAVARTEPYETVGRLTEVFYRVRYGGQELSGGLRRRLGRVIARLDEELGPEPAR